MASDFSSFSHDVKNILTGIHINLQIIKRKAEKNDQSVLPFIQTIERRIEEAVQRIDSYREAMKKQ